MDLKSIAKRFFCVSLAATMLFISGCGDKDVVSSGSESSDSKRELPEEKKTYTEVYEPEYKAKTVEWGGPDGYTIIYSNNTTGANALAVYLRNFFFEKCGIELNVENDTVKSADSSRKEILIGDTNRYKTDLSEKKFAVKLDGNKLIFEGGHFAMVEKAVDWFMTEEYKEGYVVTLEGEARDFSSIRDGGYVYVWGDEFDGNFLDGTKFNEYNHMGRTTDMRVLFGDEKVTDVEEGLLKLRAIRYYDESNAEYQYAVGSSLCTGDTMWWKFGYAEIRARLPMKQGAWPAWWTTTDCNISKYCAEVIAPQKKNWDYSIEVDMFEVFSSTNEITPNLNKWYKNYSGEYKKIYLEDGTLYERGYTDWEPYVLEDSDENSYVYHTFGFEWTPTDVIMTIDGEVYGKMNFETENIDTYSSMDEYTEQYMHMIFDNWIYAPMHAETIKFPQVMIVPESLPTEFFIDYVRLYQIPGQGELVNIGIDNFLK